jgi:hypothetical protein
MRDGNIKMTIVIREKINPVNDLRIGEIDVINYIPDSVEKPKDSVIVVEILGKLYDARILNFRYQEDVRR